MNGLLFRRTKKKWFTGPDGYKWFEQELHGGKQVTGPCMKKLLLFLEGELFVLSDESLVCLQDITKKSPKKTFFVTGQNRTAYQLKLSHYWNDVYMILIIYMHCG